MRKLYKFYVYIYRDPTNGNVPVYVGKGTRDRVWVHAKATQNLGWLRRKCRIAGLELKPEIIWCKTEKQSFALEFDLICKFGLKTEGGSLQNKRYGKFVTNPARWMIKTNQRLVLNAAGLLT